MNRKLLLSFFSLTIISFSVFGQIVNTQFGQIQGALNGSTYQFLGIPFAKPPIDSLRWRAPLNPDNWAGVLTTTNFAPVCPQKNFETGGTGDTIIGNEDCLYLNVWTPQLVTSNLPVMVFIHGGGNQQGSASEVNGGTEMFFGKNLAERGNAVVVTIQYRLGPLGFLVHPGLEPENPNGVSGNYAILDQILALTWVKNNISNFGGDSTKVMIFGESAGGLNVGNLLTSPLAAGLFQRACIQSAVPVIGDYNAVKADGVAFVNDFTTVGTDVQKINYMRTLSSDSLVSSETPPLSGGAVGMNWLSVLDSVVFMDYPLGSFQSGNFNHVPLMIGSNSEEMSLSAPPTVFPFMVTALIDTIVPVPLQPQATLLYPPGSTTADARASYIGILTDAQFTSPTRRVAQCVSQNQTEPVYRYFFTHKHSIAALAPYGSYHGMELFYVFNTWEDALLGTGPLFSAQDDSVQTAMLNYWVNFANTGDPNGGSLETWPSYASATDCYLEIKATPNGSQCGLRTLQSDLWDSSVGFVPCTTLIGVDEFENNANDFIVFPNPTSNSVSIASKNSLEPMSITIYDFTGKEIGYKENASFVDLSEFSAGMYFITIRQNGRMATKKIIKN